jgi:type II secretory pathway pseudopilin PulG
MSNTTHHPHKRRGITLLETLMTVTLIGTLTAMGLPQANSVIRQRRVIAASNALAGDIESAFSVAARQRRPVRVLYDASAGEIRVADRASGVIYSRRPLKETSEFRLDAAGMSPSSIEVFPVGVGSAPFTITLTSGSFKRQVVATRAGITRIVVP